MTKREPAAARRQPYHHGDLREALLKAAEAELIAKGIEGFSLRGAAKRAGVSHAAPAHHFKDTAAMLTALATTAFERLHASMTAHHTRADKDPRAQFIASGVGYVEFALENPALFKLMFGSERPDSTDETLHIKATEAFMLLVGDVATLLGENPLVTDKGRLDVASAWSIVHGIANLLIANRLQFLRPMMDRDHKEMVARMIERVVPD